VDTLPQKEHGIHEQDLEIPPGHRVPTTTAFSPAVPTVGTCTQELNTEIVDDAKFERREEEPGAGQTNSRKNSKA